MVAYMSLMSPEKLNGNNIHLAFLHKKSTEMNFKVKEILKFPVDWLFFQGC